MLGGAVVLLELDRPRPAVELGKAENVLHLGTAEPVDGLVVVTDDANETSRTHQKLEQIELRSIGVLILID